MPDSFGFLQGQKRGDFGQFDGTAWRASGSAGTSGQFWKKGADGLWVPATLVPADLGTSGMSLGDLLAAQGSPLTWETLSAGAANTVLRSTGPSSVPAYGQIVAGDITNNTITAAQIAAGTITAAEIANRTRRIGFDLGAGVLIAGTGAFTSSSGLRFSFPDAEAGERDWGISTPADLVTGGGTLYWLWETATTSPAVCQFRLTCDQSGNNQASGFAGLLDWTANYTANGTGNNMTLSSLALASNLTAGQSKISVIMIRNGAAAADTINATVYIRAFWLEYTADS